MERLHRLDARIRASGMDWRTLDPHRREATRLCELSGQLLDGERNEPLVRAFVGGLADAVEEQLDSFPHNLFWDFDYMAASLLREARTAGSKASEHLQASWSWVTDLERQYGRHGPICFRYCA